MKLHNFFDLIVYINLDSRPDRNETVLKEFAKLNIEPTRISGENYRKTNNPHENGVAGCTLSHIKCLNMALEKNANILIFEDDVKFINDTVNIVESALDDIRNMNWDMLYFGSNVCAPVYQISQYLGKLTWAQSTHAYSVNKKFVKKLLNYIPNQIYPLDLVYTSTAVKNDNCYITVPMVAIQQESYSDIELGVVNYEKWMEKRFFDNLIPIKNHITLDNS